MRRLIPLLPALVLCLGLTTTAAWAAGPKIVLDGLELRPDVPPYQTAGRTMVPLRVIGENLYAVVDWNPARKEVTVVQDGKTIVLTVGSNRALVNGETRLLDVSAATRNGRTFVPLRFVSEALGCRVDYRSGVITITSPDDGSLAYLLEASRTYLGIQSVKYQGNLQGTVKVTGNGVTESENVRISMSGWSRNPDQAYVEMNLATAGQSEIMRLYVDGGTVYMQQGDGPWTMSSPPAVLPVAGMQNPVLFAQNLKQTADLVQKLGIRTRFAADTQVNGQDCQIVVYKLGRDRFFSAMVTIMGELARTNQEMLGMDADAEQVVQFLQALVQKFNLQVRICIARETGLMVREVIGLEMAAGGASMGGGTEMTLNGAIDFTDYNGEITPPDVSGAVGVSPY